MNINSSLDLSLDSVYDIQVNRDRSLDAVVSATFMSGNTEVPFYFSGFSGACFTIKNEFGTILMTFNTNDGSIVLSSTGNTFQLIKTYQEMATVRSGVYPYDMYLSNAQLPKRAFLRGKINFISNIGN